ncbi:SurA N-terminal domain-containing protein [Streptomyces sp. WMMC500]|uniref:SurA N-terminal domain-containing protein n=1 Tax=Streptomyces sp. WMMC500 TaxID=3015154 RepID=UPI00248C6BFE|nr:SurA N-terminal domain-containing protein [Streptomyces sp. WMMC500]WBB58914.1 SurA N-terminal domain-containing protein [Streptomyces sp. WMMC500]
MRRTALAVTAAAFIAAVPLLSSCSGEPRAGAAAVLGDDERITVAQLQNRVADVREAQNASPQADEMIDQSGDLSVDTLNSMLQGRVIEQAAENHGVTVPRGEVQSTRRDEADAVGGEKQLQAMYLQQYSIPPQGLDTHYKQQLMVQGLVEELGIDPQTQEGQARLGGVLVEASEDLGIDVSPRFGEWDDEQVRLGRAETPWIKQVSAAPEGGVAPQQ